jgi:transcription initiation factor TFIIIB Brf1 subunit/transcription initiation factor TFIIB
MSTTDEGFLACGQCGHLDTDIIDVSPEWTFGGEGNKVDQTRCGMAINPLLPESSFGSIVLHSNNNSAEMHKIRCYTEWQSVPYKEKTRYDEFQYIAASASAAGLPRIIVDEAMFVYKTIMDNPVSFRGDVRDGIILASIHVACGKHGVPRTIKEVAAMFHKNSTCATKGCKKARQLLQELGYAVDTLAAKPADFVERYCSMLVDDDDDDPNRNKALPQDLVKLAVFIAMKIDRDGHLVENTPQSVAAGVVYFIATLAQVPLDQARTRLSAISDISAVTIVKCYKKIAELTATIVPPSIAAKYAPVGVGLR